MIFRLLAVFALVAGGARAQVLDFPSNATLQREQVTPLDSHVLPVGIWDRGVMPTRTVEGRMTRQSWRIDAAALTTLQIVRPLREQLQNNRYRIIFECQTEACGGFDFRFALDLFPPPEMRVNIGDFRFLAAERAGADGPEYVSLMASRTAQAGFVQIIHVGPEAAVSSPLAATVPAPAIPQVSAVDGDLGQQLDQTGRAVLADLTFETGSAQLGGGSFASLQALAAYLLADPQRRVALVGHTDTSGSLDGNIALSKRRAASVLERLVSDYSVPRGQLAAEGMGYLAPVATNQTAEGREANRRVEVIVTDSR